MYLTPMCLTVRGPGLQGYLGRADVRAALGAAYPRDTPNKVYHVALDNNGYPQYEVQYDACNDAPRAHAPSLLAVWRKLLAHRTVLLSLSSVLLIDVASPFLVERRRHDHELLGALGVLLLRQQSDHLLLPIEELPEFPCLGRLRETAGAGANASFSRA